jgi:ribosomal protein S27E
MAYYGSQQQIQCPDCKGIDIVEDHAQGDMVCRVREKCSNGPRSGPLTGRLA